MKLYNKNLFWCPELESKIELAMAKKYYIIPSRHFNLKSDSLYLFDNEYKMALKGNIIECMLDERNNIIKIITRQKHPHKSNCDICFAIGIEYPNAKIITAWINESNDHHSTLKKEDYNIGW